MTPDERALLEKTYKLAKENSAVLARIDRRNKWVFIWGVAKLVIIVVPLILAVGYLEPYLRQLGNDYRSVQELVAHIDLPF
jgi:hypothetical protein